MTVERLTRTRLLHPAELARADDQPERDPVTLARCVGPHWPINTCPACAPKRYARRARHKAKL